jgi:hypothetical protein
LLAADEREPLAKLEQKPLDLRDQSALDLRLDRLLVQTEPLE